MTLYEQPCYTLIQCSSDTEQPSEMQLKMDLGKFIKEYENYSAF